MAENKKKIFQKTKRSQEEMVGFALIVIIVAVILLIILGFSLRRSSKEQILASYEAESFVQALLQCSSSCADNLEYLSVQNLIISCHNTEICEDGREACSVLNSTLEEIIEKSWDVGEERPFKGYILTIKREEAEVFSLKEGNETGNYKAAIQGFTRKGADYQVSFNVYY